MKKRNIENLFNSPIQASCQGIIAGKFIESQQGSYLENSILWDQISIGRNCSLRSVIVTSGVTLEPTTHLDNAIVTPLPKNIGEQVISGAKIQNNCLIWPL